MLAFDPGLCYHIGETKGKEMQKYKTLAEKWLSGDNRFKVSYDPKTFKYGIVEKDTGKFFSPDRWISRKFAEEYLSVSVALGKI